MRALVYDFETPLITEEVPFPEPVCMSYVKFDTEDTSARQPSRLVLAEEGYVIVREEMAAGALLVNTYIAYEIMLMWLHCPASRPQLVHALENDRVTCILRRQFLVDCAYDKFRRRYALDSVAKAMGVKVPDKQNPWRMKFAELKGVPIADYPEEASHYCLEDADVPVDIFMNQEALRHVPRFKGADCLAPEFFSTFKSVVLADMAGCGMWTDPASVECFRELLREEAGELRETLIAAGLVRAEVVRDQQAIAKRVLAWNPCIKRVATGKPSLTEKTMRNAPAELAALRDRTPTGDGVLVQAGLAEVVYKRSDKAARELMADVLGWYSTGDKEYPWRDRWEERHAKPPLDADACTKTKHPTLLAYSRYQSVMKTLSTDINLALKACEKPFVARYYMAKNGREITGAGGNLQNMPREPGIRELWVAPPGEVFISADYPALELRTFGQICKNVFGFSQVLDDLNDGVDLHSGVVADLLHIRLEEVIKRKKEGDPLIGRARTMGKAVNFGTKGGMGAERFVGYVWNNYKIDLELYVHLVEGATEAIDVAKYLLDIHESRTPEFRPYKKNYVGSFERPGENVFDVQLPYSGMLCAGLRYSDACNFPFSHLATIVAGTALINCFLARHGFSELGTEDPLYGTKARLFVHDEIVYSCEESVADPAAERLADIMREAAEFVMPDAQTPVEACVHRQLSKLAEPVRDCNGSLIPWSVFKAAHAVRHDPDKLARFPRWVALHFKG